MLIVSSILTLGGLAGLGAVVGLAYALLVVRQHRATGRGHARPPAGPAPPRRLLLRGVVEALVSVGDDETTFLDRTSLRFVTLCDELLAELEGDEPIEDDPIDFTRAELEDLRRKLRSKALLQLPTKAETKEFLLRERFCEELPDGEIKEQMLKVLRAETGFRSFDGAVQRLGIAEQWQLRRDAEFATIAMGWLQKNGIPFDDAGFAAIGPPPTAEKALDSDAA